VTGFVIIYFLQEPHRSFDLPIFFSSFVIPRVFHIITPPFTDLEATIPLYVHYSAVPQIFPYFNTSRLYFHVRRTATRLRARRQCHEHVTRRNTPLCKLAAVLSF
jgi:hypothetical protein